MLARHIEDNQANVMPLGLLEIDVLRNGYGRQVFSFEAELEAKLNGVPSKLTATFIRAPKITRKGDKVTSLAEYEHVPVLVEQGHVMASSFHSELDEDTTLLAYFLKKHVGAW
jgi:5'-phosphate synthase pdxT subunit